MKRLKHVAATASLCGLMACGGGGGTDQDKRVVNTAGGGQGIGNYTPFAARTSGAATQLTYVAITNTGTSSSGNAGSLDHQTGRVTGGLLAGRLNDDATEILLLDGATAELTNPADTSYVRHFSTSGTGADRFGAVGQQTISQDLPTFGISTYLGRADVQADDGAATYALTGNARITANWDTNRATTQLRDLSGTRNDASRVEAGDLTISDGQINNGQFTGGAVSAAGSIFSLSGSERLTGSIGRFFGPEAGEVGGTIVIDDTAAGSLRLQGVYTAD